MLFLCALPSVFAQAVVSAGATPALNAQTFRASMDSHEFIRLVDSDVPDGLAARAVMSYTLAPLQYEAWDGTTSDLVGSIFQTNVLVAYGIGPFRLGVDVPLLGAFGGTTAGGGLGDLGLDAKIRLMDPAKKPVGLAFSARTALPTSTLGGALGASGVGLDLIVSVDRDFGERVEGALNVGVGLQPDAALENVTWGNVGVIQPGVSVAMTDHLRLNGEVYLAGLLADLSNPNGRPGEALVGLGYRTGPRDGVAISPAVAVGLGDAVTTPRLRALLGVAWDPIAPPPPPDRDGDGLVDDVDRCPDVAEDVDSYEDQDGCVELARVMVRVIDTDGIPVEQAGWTAAGGASGTSGGLVELPAGNETFTSMGVSSTFPVPAGGTSEVVITVPAPRGALEVRLVEKSSGKPVNDGRWRATGPTPVPTSAPGVVSARPGLYVLIGEAPGFRPARSEVLLQKDGTVTLQLEMVPARAEIRAEKIVIQDSVYFETGKAIIKPESFPLLEEVADILKDHPELTKVRIEGNTDSRGDAKANLSLSQARAESVKAFLTSRGVAGERLVAIGYGESRPIVKEKTAADQAKNRRVDFFVAERSDAGVPGEVRRVETPSDVPREK